MFVAMVNLQQLGPQCHFHDVSSGSRSYSQLLSGCRNAGDCNIMIPSEGALHEIMLLN